MTWWITQPGRALRERAEVSDLAERVDWLTNVHWRFKPGLILAADFEVTAGDQTYPFTITYPNFFPDAPPSVTPRNAIRLSSHQYGVGGEMCLEYRADNWSPAVTGALMIESTHRLIAGELDQAAPPLPSAHLVTLGQEVRSSFVRFVLSRVTNACLSALPANQPFAGALVEHVFAKTWVARLTRLGPEAGPLWADPATVQIGVQYDVTVVRLDDAVQLPGTLTLATIEELAPTLGLDMWIVAAKEKSLQFLLFYARGKARLVTSLLSDTNVSILEYKSILLSPPQRRLPNGHEKLATKTVAIVGCGSVGTKVALSLARTGVSSFLLVDSDVLLPENLVRNGLDGRSVGVNKACALQQQILELSSDASVRVRQIDIGGQETGESTASAMVQLAECDLIVDATAAPKAFNVCAAVSRRERKPMVWGVVYGGGIGGLIARARPDLDPPPLEARRQIDAWCDEQGRERPSGLANGYDAQTEEGQPLIASDADVSIIAAHLTRFAIDILLEATPSAFPHSAYAIGLSPGWIFSEPFETWPIDLQPGADWGPEFEPDAAEDLKALVAELFPGEVADAG